MTVKNRDIGGQCKFTTARNRAPPRARRFPCYRQSDVLYQRPALRPRAVAPFGVLSRRLLKRNSHDVSSDTRPVPCAARGARLGADSGETGEAGGGKRPGGGPSQRQRAASLLRGR